MSRTFGKKMLTMLMAVSLSLVCLIGVIMTVNLKAEATDGKLWDVKMQLRVNRTDSEKMDIRFVTGIDSLEYQNVYFQVEVKNTEGKVYKQGNLVEKVAYTTILANNEKVYPDKDFGKDAKFFVIHTLTGIPESCFDDIFTVTTYSTALNGDVTKHETVSFTLREKMTANVTFTYPDSTTETIQAIYGKGLKTEPKVGYNNPFLKTSFNGVETTDLETACKSLTADATVTYAYTSRTTNTMTGTGIAMAADGKVTLTGPQVDSDGVQADEANPTNANDKLYASAAMRQVLVAAKRDNYSVLKATVTSDNYIDGAVGFALTVNDKMAMVGIYKSGKAFIHSWAAGSNPEGAITYQTTKPLDWKNGVELAFVQNYGNYYLFANNELVLKFGNNVKWSWGWNGNVSWDMGFSQRGRNVVTFADYTFEIGKEAVSKYLSRSVQVGITYPDGTTDTITSEFDKGLATEPTVGYDNPFLTAYLNDKPISDLKEVCKYLREDVTITYTYTSRTTNTTDSTKGIAMAADGTVTLTGQVGNDFATLADEKNPATGASLNRYDAMRQIIMPDINGEYWVLKTKVTSDNVMTYGGAVGFALTVNDKMAFVGVYRDGRGEVHSYAAGTNPAGCFKNTDRELLKLNWTSGVELVLVCDNDTYHMYADGTEVVTFKSGVSWGWQTGVVSQPVGLAQRSPSTFKFTEYTVATGQDAVNEYVNK